MILHGNTVLITGGSRGIGLEFARQLIGRGNQVIVTGRNPEALQELQQKVPGLYTVRSDVTCINDIKDLYHQLSEQFPDLNILINNAGIGNRLDLKKQHGVDLLLEELRTNLQAPIQMINEFLPLLTKQNKSAIINVKSALAFAPFPIVPLYSATKAGLHSYTVSLRAQFPHFLRSNLIKHISKRSACFRLLVQHQTSLSLPIEDPTRPWSEQVAPFREIARTLVPTQNLMEETKCEKIVINPWNSLLEHKPVGGINRLRLADYLMSIESRNHTKTTPIKKNQVTSSN